MLAERTQPSAAVRIRTGLSEAWSGALVAFFLPVVFVFVAVAPQGLAWLPVIVWLCVWGAMLVLGDRVDWPILGSRLRIVLVPLAAFVLWAWLRCVWMPALGDVPQILATFTLTLFVCVALATLAWSLKPRGQWFWQYFPIVLLLASVGLGVVLAALTFGGWRLTSEHRMMQVWHYNRAALFLVLLWPISMFAISRLASSPWLRTMYRWLTTVTVGVVVLISWSESAKLAFVVIVGFYLLALARPHLTRIVMGLGGVAAVLLAVPLIETISLAIHASTAIPMLEEAVDDRLKIWKGLVDIVLASPWIGHGVEYVRANGYFDLALNRVVFPHHPHSALLQVWIDLGLVGALLLALVILACSRLISVADRNRAAMYLALMAGILTIWSVSHGMWQSWYAGLAGLLVVFAVWADRRALHDETSSQGPDQARG